MGHTSPDTNGGFVAAGVEDADGASCTASSAAPSEAAASCSTALGRNSSRGDDRKEWSLAAFVAVGAASAVCSVLFMLLLMRGNMQLTTAGARLLRRWRRR